MKKLSVILATAILAVSLAGCSSKNPAPTKTTADKPEETTAETVSEETDAKPETTAEGETEEETTETTVDNSDKSYMDVVDFLCENCGFSVVKDNENPEITHRIIIDDDDPSVVSTAVAGLIDIETTSRIAITIYDETDGTSFETDVDNVVRFPDDYVAIDSHDDYLICSRLMSASRFADNMEEYFSYGYYDLGYCYIKVIIQTHTTFDASTEWYEEVNTIMSQLGLDNPMRMLDEYNDIITRM